MLKKKAVIVSGPSGSGKSTLVNNYAAAHKDYTVIRTCTTRLPRFEGEAYRFLRENEFLKEASSFLETNYYNGHYYGSRISDVMDAFEENRIPVLVIDTNGRKAVKERAGDYGFSLLSIFIVSPPEIIYSRLVERDGLSYDTISRLKASLQEVRMAEDYDAFIVNEELCKAETRFCKALEGQTFSEDKAVLKRYVYEAEAVIIKAAADLLRNDLTREPLEEEVAEKADITLEKVRTVLGSLR